jgi:hypothetical protein
MTPYDLTLDEMLADPIVRRLMERDGVAEAEVRGLSDYVRRRRGPQSRSPAPDRIDEEPRVFAS